MPSEAQDTAVEQDSQSIFEIWYNGLWEVVDVLDQLFRIVLTFAVLALGISGPLVPLAILVNNNVMTVPDWLPPASLLGWWLLVVGPLYLGWNPSEGVE